VIFLVLDLCVALHLPLLSGPFLVGANFFPANSSPGTPNLFHRCHSYSHLSGQPANYQRNHVAAHVDLLTMSYGDFSTWTLSWRVTFWPSFVKP